MNNFIEKINLNIINKHSYVCVGLDIDLEKIPDKFKKSNDPIFEFNKYIIDLTKDYTAAYKPNMAFYEMYGLAGLKALYETIRYIPKEIPVILDAKRGDIGNTSKAYAKAIFEDFKADAVTLAPYMGTDSVTPFLEYKEKFSYILCLTSNKGSLDFQKPDLYKKVAVKINDWNSTYHNCGAVVGATNTAEITEVRSLMPTIPFLIPGIGAQGGDLENTVKNAIDKNKQGILINSSRGIIYAEDPAQAAADLQKAIQDALK
jgi:orotidine 5'-phosphate decarboxylase subfamily 2